MKTTKEVRDIVLFMAMGDGHLSSSGILSFRHCLKQKDYLDWKYNILKGRLKCSEPYYVDNNGYGSFEFRTRTYKFIKLYRKVIYKNGKKDIFSRKMLNKLTPLGLAIWYMDDGSLSQKKDKNGKIVSNDLTLNTYLSKEQNQVIIDYFNEVWNIRMSQAKSKGKYRIRCATKEARKFIAIVKPFVEQVPSMQHKLKIKPELSV